MKSMSSFAFRKHVAAQQDPMSAAAAEKHLAMISPFCTFECLILDFMPRYGGGQVSRIFVTCK